MGRVATNRSHETQRHARLYGLTAAIVVGIAIALVAIFWAAQKMSSGAASATAGSMPPPIAGGEFEASGVAHVPNTNQLLFVDDGTARQIFLMELTRDGKQQGAAVPIALSADVTDLEGMTFDGRHFYVVGSQSKLTGFEGDGLVRFTFDPKTRLVGGVERIQGLKTWLAANVAELRGTETLLGDHVLNIEAIAWDSAGNRLLLGLRAPVVDGQALIVPVKLGDSGAAFSRDNLRVDGPAIRVSLDGAGIRSLEYDDRVKAYRLVTGATLNEETLEFRLVEWNGMPGSPVRDIATYSRHIKPEGITRAEIDGRDVTVMVFDVGRFAMWVDEGP